MKELNISFGEFTPGYTLEVEPISLSEDQIIEFAKRFDPLDFHTDREVAKQSFFKGLIASGPHFFNEVYQQHFLPRFKHTIVCGLELTNWKFIKPIYADFLVKTTIKVADIQPNHEKGVAAVKWIFHFHDTSDQPVQYLEMTVLHRMR